MNSVIVADRKDIAGRYGHRVTRIREWSNPEWFFVLDGQPLLKASPELLLRGAFDQRSRKQ